MIQIIDGYNVMHAIEDGAGIKPQELEEKRDSFIESVVNLAATTGEEMIVVFDSRKGKSPQNEHISGTGVTVWYASARESADIIIGKLVQEKLSTTADEIKVVSADWEVQRVSMKKKVERVPPRHFLSQIKKIEKKVANSSEMDKMHGKIEDKVDVETLRKLEDMRRGNG